MLLGTGDITDISAKSVNLLSESCSENHYTRLGLEVVLNLSGEVTTAAISRAHGVSLNIVQNSMDFLELAKSMESNFGIPYIITDSAKKGVEDLIHNLYMVAEFFNIKESVSREISKIVSDEIDFIIPQIMQFRRLLEGKSVFLSGINRRNRQLVNIIKNAGMNVTNSEQSSDLIISDDSDKSNYINIKYATRIYKSGYIGVLKLYDFMLQQCDSKQQVATLM